MSSIGPDLRKEEALEAEIQRLHLSVDRLSDAVVDLKEDMRRQAARTESLAEKQDADFRSLLTMLQETYGKLVERQDAAFKTFGDRLDKLFERQDAASTMSADRFDKLVERQDAASKDSADRFDRLVDRQDVAFKSFADRLDKFGERQDASSKAFADRLDRLVERQDSHFRWLAGLVVASALSVGIAVVKLH